MDKVNRQIVFQDGSKLFSHDCLLEYFARLFATILADIDVVGRGAPVRCSSIHVELV